MSERRFREPYQEAQQRYDAARRETLAVLTEAVRHGGAWQEEGPVIEDHLGRQLEGLWRGELGLRPWPRLRRKLPAMPWQRVDRRLRGFRRRRLRSYRKRLRRLARAATASWPARRMRLATAWMELRLRVSTGWAFLLIAAVALVLIDRLAPWLIEDFFALFVAGGAGP